MIRARSLQLDLFGGEPSVVAVEARDPLGEVPEPDPELVELAARVPHYVRFGTSSWTFPGWSGLVYRRRYPSERVFVQRSLEEYVRFPLFRTVGIDRSFWAPIPERDLARYATQMTPGFEGVMKVWDELTMLTYPSHPRYGPRAGQVNPHFLDPGVFRHVIAEPVERTLGDRLAAYVLEFPPPTKLPDRRSWERALARFFEDAPRSRAFVVELRDKRLLTPRHLDLLRAHRVGHVLNHWSRMPSIGAQLEMAGSVRGPGDYDSGGALPPVVARLMLPQGASYEEQKSAFAPFDALVAPDPEMRADVVALARACRERGAPLFVIVNNKVEGSSPHTVRALAELLAPASPCASEEKR